MPKYVFEPHEKIFEQLFIAEQKRIQKAVKEPIVIEHIGSTAILGLAGKGIIDIAVGGNKEDMQTISQELQKIEYEFRPGPSTEERLFHRIDLPDSLGKLRRYHVHLTYLNSRDWQEMIAFRNYLRSNKEARERYANLKQYAANTVNEDGVQYRKLKEPMIQEILKKALSEK